jgi:tetratricopeptide (TPR) repeat protein/predicted AlkP superfamily phosphohydrolase/phosphomutase
LRVRSVIFAILIVGLAIAAAGLHRVPSGEFWVVRDAPVLQTTPTPVSPGIHFLIPFLYRLYPYPTGTVSMPFDFGGPGDSPPRQLSREGARVRVQGELATRIDPDRLAQLHREAGPEYPVHALIPMLRTHLLERLRSVPTDGSERGREEIGLQLANDIRAPMQDLGLHLVALGIDRLQPVATGGSEPEKWMKDSGLSGSRVLLIGWDGADWNLIDRLTETGRMPNLSRLLETGTRARLKTIQPVLSPVIWTSIATGMNPERHGIIDFVATDTSTGMQIPVTSNLRKTRALWNLISDAGLEVGVIGWLATWPAETVHGYLVSDRVASQLLGFEENWLKNPEGKVYPFDLWPLLLKEIIPPKAISDEVLDRFFATGRFRELPDSTDTDELVEGLREILATTQTHTGLHLRLGADRPARFEAVYYPGIDRVSHLFMQFRPPPMPWVSPEVSSILGEVVDRFYQYQDSLLGDLLDRTGPDTTVVLCSDHGFRTGLDRPRTDPRIGHGRAADWHRKYGILVLNGTPIQPGKRLERASVLDVAPTVLTLIGLPVPTDLEGRVLVEALRPDYHKNHPVRYRGPVNIPSEETGPPVPVVSEVDATIREQLLSLGYLSQETLSGHNNLGILHLTNGRVDEAIREFELALQENPRFLVVRINLGRAYMAKGDPDRAREILRGVVVADPDAKEAWLLLANLAIQEGSEVAERYFLKAVSIDPNDTETLNGLGLLYDGMGRWEEAIEQYRRVIMVDPDYEKAYNNIGVIFQRQGRLEEAGVMFERAIEADPDFSGSYNNLGIVRQEQGDLAGAEQAYRIGLERNPTHPVLRNSLGGVLFRSGQPEKARRQFEIALRIDPGYESAHNNLGAVLGHLGDRQGQMDHYLQAIALRGDYTDARHNLALAYLETGREADGILELENVLEIEPGHLASLLRLAAERIRRAELESAESLLQEAIRRYPDQSAARNLFGHLRLTEGRTEEARQWWEDSLRLNPAQPEVRASLQKLPAPTPPDPESTEGPSP